MSVPDSPVLWAAVIAAVANILVSTLNHRQTTSRIQNIEIKIDGRLDELLGLMATSKLAEGSLEGRAELHAEQKARLNAPKP